jgi:hypothetical protein
MNTNKEGFEMVSDQLASYLLGTMDGFGFERPVQKLLAKRYGDQFVALGGVKDGGADGFVRAVLEDSSRPTSFVQMSIQENAVDKIRKTANRLKEYGREVKTLVYWTNRKLIVDTLEETLSEELGVTVRVRDWDSVLRLVNWNNETVKVFNDHFRAELFELTNAPAPIAAEGYDLVSDPSVYVFLEFERGERFSRGGLVAPIVDSLIYWALRGTNPDGPNLLSRAELKKVIAELLPGAANILLPNVDARLKVLSAKDGGGNQRVRHYKQVDSYCLPHAMRALLAAESATERSLRADLMTSLAVRATECGATQPKAVAAVCERALYRHFHEQGLILAAFLEKRLDGITVSDQIVEEELRQAAGFGEELSPESYAAALRVLQGIFYTPSKLENEFLHRLSKTTLLLFTLRHSPRLVEYFNRMTGKFRLLIGTDILVKALSESFLPLEHRHVTNLMKVAKACGATLVLAEPVVNEVFAHLHGTHLEFRNHYSAKEPYVTPAIASQSDRIMIRTYFYAKLLMGKVSGWRSFIEMFVEVDDLANKSARGEAQLQAYLCKTFELEPLSRSEISKGVDLTQVEALANTLGNSFKNDILAMNDALMCFSIYAQRTRGNESLTYDGFGLRTWWLTKETSLLQHTGKLVKENGGTPFIMRPEFLLNFLSSAPKAAEIDPVVRDLLPSHVGLQIGQHMNATHMHKLLGHVEDWKVLPEARREIRITDAVDRLKFDRLKRYEKNLDIAGVDEADAVLSALRDEKKS